MGIAPPGSHGSERNSLPLFGSCHLDPQDAVVHAQWANSTRSWQVMRCQASKALRNDRSRLNFRRSQRIK